MTINNISINELEIKEIGMWPLEFRVGVIILACLIEIALMCFFYLQNDFNINNQLKEEQERLLLTFKDTYKHSANLDKYKNQMTDIEKMLQIMLRQLPPKGEIASLIEDISQQAAISGLRFDLIKPGEPLDKEFYVEQPIQMILIGKYHSFGKFAENISKLSRIVTLHDFVISKVTNPSDRDAASKDQSISGVLTMKIQAKTYWYVAKDKV